ncbi:WXG100 family type VII secretion target [Saccharothrix tamanrassetensis]|uniref:WXG100 family type VII secretion target n=1 Tax=Saccharothrix tamanrassetensis TaxID=1051531 RepID=A0A841CLJ7_9PSEU|nr:WXG100 family type VII secretion target [Saccharothrix tamanrassetensis]MBB5957244.1 WXG100 family type VII secretion target [Saccharothrix tamanrassetensis]
MTALSGYEIYQMVSRGAGPGGLNQAADVSKDARTRIQSLGDELRRLTAEMQAAWQGKAADRAAQAVQPIEQALQRAQETLDKADASLRTQAETYGLLKQQVLPMATPQPPELTLFDELTPWDTDNEIARKEWFVADANNRRVYAEYATATGRNEAMLPQMSQAAGGAQGANTAVQGAGGGGVQSATSPPPQVGNAGTTSPSSAGSAGGEAASVPPSMSGGGGTSVSSAGSGGDGVPAGRAPAAHGTTAPKQRGDRTAVADWSAGVPGGVPVATRPLSARDTARTSNVPKGDHLSGAAAVLPGGIGIGDPTGTRGQRAPLGAGDRSAALGRTLPNAPAAAGARGVAGRVGVAGMGGAAGIGGAAGMGGFAPHAAHAREEEDREYKRSVYLEEDSDALIGRLPGTVAPVIGED